MDGVAEESRATMASKSSDSASKPRNSHGGEKLEGIGDLTHKMNQLRKQIQAERAVSIKEKVEKNRKKLEIDVSQLKLATFRNDALFAGQSGSAPRLISSRMGNPLCKYGGFGYGLGDKDYINSHEVAALMSTKLSYIEKIPPYTTWIFLARNQRMAEDQSVVGRRRIYYDQHGSEALICSDSEEEVEPGEEKRYFSEGEDRIMWMVFQEHGLSEEVLNAVSQFIGATPSEIQERCSTLKEKYNEEPNIKDSGDSRPEIGISVDKSLSAALDSFDNLFCRRCLLFDCRLHGCSQTLIDPSERQPYWPEYEDNRKPCSDQCYLRVMLILASAFQLRGAKDLPEVNKSLSRKDTENLVKENIVEMSSDAGEPSCTDGAADLMQAVSISPKDACNSELVAGARCLDMPTVETQDPDHLRKRRALAYTDKEIDESIPIIDDRHDSSCKKHRRLLAVDLDTETVDDISNPAQSSSAAKTAIYKTELQVSKNTVNDSSSHASESFVGSQQNFSDVKDVTEVNKSSGILRKLEGIFIKPEWNLIEKELYMKGVEIFGKNSCLIARNLLSGLKTCLEVSNYMCNSGATMSHRSLAPSSFMEDNGENDTDYGDQDMSTRTRLFRRRGRTRKLKYSWKSAGHPSFWKRIVEGKNLSCKQYTPCGCQSMCGKQCPCLDNGTCCEKYCGCSKSCKNRFRGCHCAKSQCRSRQCPCFAAGRECDPDVCRNCWVSCGGDSLGEPPKRGDGQCGNMRLLLRQQQRILLAKSDVAGWGAFLKNSVNKNDYLGEYTGELISHREADKRGKIYDRANSSFLFDLNDQYVLDAYRKGDKLKFANHSSNPNCYAKVMLVAGDHRVGIFAKEHIDASEELFYDYRYGPDQAPAWARKPEGSKRDDSTVSQGRAKKHQSH